MLGAAANAPGLVDFGIDLTPTNTTITIIGSAEIVTLVGCSLITGALLYYADLLWGRPQGIDICPNYLAIPPE